MKIHIVILLQLSDVKDFDVLLAGFPCQAFSSAGKRLGFEDTRGTLFFDVARLIATKQPSMCVLENVRGLVSHNKGKTFETIKNVLSDLGHQFEYRLLNSSNYGVAQNRVRIYIVGVKDAKPILTLANDAFAAVDSHAFKQSLTTMDLFESIQPVLVKDILESNPNEYYDCSDTFISQLTQVFDGDLDRLHGIRLIDSRGNSIHSWDLGFGADNALYEIDFMNLLIANVENISGTHQDGKALSKEQIATFIPKGRI